jgi:hypothetical protein
MLGAVESRIGILSRERLTRMEMIPAERPALVQRLPTRPLGSAAVGVSVENYRQRALVLWPRLDPARLARAGGDPRRIARIVGRRTALPLETIVAMLTGEAVAPSSTETGRTARGRSGGDSAILGR